jgi:hypothetical protein
LPGVRLTLSPSGISTSIGVGPFRVTSGPRGTSATARIPGTGVSFRHSVGDDRRMESDPPSSNVYIHTPTPSSWSVDMRAIESAGSGTLTTPGLEEFKKLLEQAHRTYREITSELSEWRIRETYVVRKRRNWEKGWVFRRIFTTKFEELGVSAEEATARRVELEEQEQLSKLQTQLEIPPRVADTFHRARDLFVQMSAAQKIWDTVGERNVDRVVERTTASRVVDRRPVTFGLARCELIASEWEVPRLQNANGGDVYLYPAFALYFVSADSFALLEYKDLRLDYSPTKFIEDVSVPSDSRLVGTAWAKANKDGSPDKRFRDNYQLPVALYGALDISSYTGLNEQYLISNNNSASAFAGAWDKFVSAVNNGI